MNLLTRMGKIPTQSRLTRMWNEIWDFCPYISEGLVFGICAGIVTAVEVGVVQTLIYTCYGVALLAFVMIMWWRVAHGKLTRFEYTCIIIPIILGGAIGFGLLSLYLWVTRAKLPPEAEES